MKKILTALMLLTAATDVFADNYNSISIQGQLTSSAPIYGVRVDILSAGNEVGTPTYIDIIPNENDFVFSTQTYINPRVFQTGGDYTMRLNYSTGTIISTFSITATPFALSVRGDAQTGNQNIFGAYGNVGIGTGTPLYRLEISSAAGSAEDIVVISTGGSPVIRMTGAGIIHANKYYGDGSSLTGITGTGDNLGNHTATQNLNMAKFDIVNVSSATFTGYVNVTSNAGYELGGETILNTPGYTDLFLGYQSGDSDYSPGNYNTMIGFLAGNPDSGGYNNSFIGSQAGFNNMSGYYNSFVGYAAGYSNTSGIDNSYLGNFSGYENTIGSRNSFLGSFAGYYNNGYDDNTYLGYSAGYMNINGSNNTYVGSDAGGDSANASNNSFLGYQAGHNTSGGNNNIYIGYKAGYSNTSTSDSIILGYNQTSSGSSTLNIGGVLYGNLLAGTLGISRTTQGAALDVVSTGTASNQFAQIWRDSSGAIKSSMSATGVMMANMFIGDGSQLTGISEGYVSKTSSQTFTGQNVFTAPTRFDSTMSVTGNTFSVGGSTYVVSNGNVGIGTTVPTARLDVAGGISSLNDIVSSGTFRGNGAGLSNVVPTTTQVNGHALSGNVNVTAADIGLGNVTNESKSTMFTSPAFTGTATFSTHLSSTSVVSIPSYTVTATAVGTCITGSTATLVLASVSDVQVNFSGLFIPGQIGNTIYYNIISNHASAYQYAGDGHINGIRDYVPMNTVIRNVPAGTINFCVSAYKNGGSFTVQPQLFSVTALP
jgi:hypothetical protein